jgi:hypothetical protein
MFRSLCDHQQALQIKSINAGYMLDPNYIYN